MIKAAKKQDIPEGKGIVAEFGEKSVAIFNVAGKFYAISNVCPHKGGPLGEGECEGTIVTCPWHAFQFDVTTGCNTDNPQLKVQCYPVRLEGEDILVEL
jgi:Ferredoxin subunits of nitrite reductase and ring-hydroxylating dioxygenases